MNNLNISLVDNKVLQFFGKQFPVKDYTLKFASQHFESSVTGQVVDGLSVAAIHSKKFIALPQLLSTDDIADTRHEVASPSVVKAHHHISHLASKFQDIDEEAEVLLLIGRDCGEAMATVCHGKQVPYAHKYPLGWALVGKTCLKENHQACNRIMRTSIQGKINFPAKLKVECLKDPFEVHSDDEESGMSVEDRKFLNIMSTEVCINNQGKIQLPIPFKDETALPNNKAVVFHRTNNMVNRLKRDPVQLSSCLISMDKSIEHGHIEEVPKDTLLDTTKKSWYLPIFPIVNPKKDKIRLVYDASAKYKNTCINDHMLQGPDLNNNLRGVLTRFREKKVGFISDIESMFNSFALPPEQRSSYKFFWFHQNDLKKNLTEYWSNCHLFGSRASPAIANYGLKFATLQPVAQNRDDAVAFLPSVSFTLQSHCY